MKTLLITLTISSLFTSCAAPGEGFVRKHTTGSPYNKHGIYRERTAIPAPWK